MQLLCPIPSHVYLQGNMFKPMINLIARISINWHLVFKGVYTEGYILSIHDYVHVSKVWQRPPVDLSVLCWYWHCAVESRHVSAQTFSLKLCLWYIYVDMSHSSTACTVFTFLVVSRSYDLFRHKKSDVFHGSLNEEPITYKFVKSGLVSCIFVRQWLSITFHIHC